MKNLYYNLLRFLIEKLLFLLFFPYGENDTKEEKENTKKVLKKWYELICLEIENEIY